MGLCTEKAKEERLFKSALEQSFLFRPFSTVDYSLFRPFSTVGYSLPP